MTVVSLQDPGAAEHLTVTLQSSKANESISLSVYFKCWITEIEFVFPFFSSCS